jgi:hypothetical protein
VPVVATSWQTPSVAPAAIAQEPPQQSVSRAQASPGWMQNEEPSAQVPPEQRPEQQPLLAVHGLPAVLQVALSAAHLPPLQLPPQHSLELPQVAPSATQAAAPQTPRVVSHCRLQQSVATAQELPAPLQVLTDEAHLLVTGSQECEQHCWSLVQLLPVTVQMMLVPPPPPVPVPLPPVPVPVPPVPVLIAFTLLPPQPAIATAAAAIANIK